MTNPYDPPASLDYAASAIPSRVAHKAPWPQRVLCVLSGAVGLIVGIHVVVATTEGPAAAIDRTVKDPDGAMVFFTVGSTVCMLLVSLWEIIRRKLLAEVRPTLASRLLMGVLLTTSLSILGAYIGEPLMRSIPASTMGNVIHVASFVLFFVLSTIVAVETEAAGLRFFGRTVSEPWRDQLRG